MLSSTVYSRRGLLSESSYLPPKCNAERPTCGNCAANSLTCEYTVPEGMTPREAEKKRIDEISMSRDNLRRVFELLRSSEESESAGILRRIRAAPTVDDAINMLLDASLLSEFQSTGKSSTTWADSLETKCVQAILPGLQGSPLRHETKSLTFFMGIDVREKSDSCSISRRGLGRLMLPPSGHGWKDY